MSGSCIGTESAVVPVDLPGGLKLTAAPGAWSVVWCVSLNPGRWLRRQPLRPWLQFANVLRLRTPDSVPQWSRRLVKNLAHFQTNYAALSLLLLLYCLLTSPLLLAALFALAGCCHALRRRQQERRLLLAGCPVALVQQYVGVAVLGVPLLLLAGASTVIVWVSGASCVVVLLHATFYQAEALPAVAEVQLVEVTTETK